jgi:hypothetical protein
MAAFAKCIGAQLTSCRFIIDGDRADPTTIFRDLFDTNGYEDGNIKILELDGLLAQTGGCFV